MIRVDAQHSFAPPHQGPDWFGKILARNRFEGSVYVPHAGTLTDALALAAQYPYIRRVVPAGLANLPDHPLIVSVRLPRPDPAALAELARRGLHAELDAAHWPFESPVPVALDGLPAPGPLPPHVYVKLTGFRLPPDPLRAARLRELLRHPGPERLMFATGWPHGGGTWKETIAAFTQSLGAMPMALREQLLGATAREFYRIG